MGQTVTTTSKQFTINLSDITRGLIVAVLTPVITIIMTSLEAGTLVFNWKAIGITALTAGLAYILKNFFTPSVIKVEGAAPRVIEQVKEGTTEVKVGNVTAPTKENQP